MTSDKHQRKNSSQTKKCCFCLTGCQKNVAPYNQPLVCFSVSLTFCFLVIKTAICQEGQSLQISGGLCFKHDLGKLEYTPFLQPKRTVSVKSKMALICPAVLCLNFLKRVLYFIILVHRIVVIEILLVSRLFNFSINLS